jgi:REP element-mobilizing transposase RayT
MEKTYLKKPVGFIAPTFPFIEGNEEEILIEVICQVASSISLEIVAFNFCGDHVHAIVRSDSTDLSYKIGLWKGKSAYEYNRRVDPYIINQTAIKSDGTKRSLWGRGYYQKYLKSEVQLKEAIKYINNNREKHHLPPLSEKSISYIRELTGKKPDAFGDLKGLKPDG